MLQVQDLVAPAVFFVHPSTQHLGRGRTRRWRDDVETMAPDQLIGTVAQDCFDRGAAERVDAVGVDLPDPFLRCLGDRAKPFFTDAQCFFSADPRGDVLNLMDEIVRLAALQPDQRGAQLRPDDASVAAHVALVGLVALDLPGKHLGHLQIVDAAIIRMGQRFDIA